MADKGLVGKITRITRPPHVSFHTPGHKSGPLFSTPSPLWDTTELEGTDHLHHPDGILKEAEDRAAAFYGSQQTYFLVNGSTCGIYAMILAATQPGDEIIINRNAHQSVYQACYLGGITPRYILPDLEPLLGLPLCMEAAAVAQALAKWPRAKALVLTRPTYHGDASDLRAIAGLVKAAGRLLLVDEAHGAHLRLSSHLPLDAMASGADAAVQSTHKTLTAFTQASLLHVQGQAIDRERLRFMLRLFQSSSPSYLLMASLDQAVQLAAGEGKRRMEDLLEQMQFTRESLEQVPGLRFNTMADPTRLWVDMHGLGLSGYELDNKLREEWHIFMELADLKGALALTTIGNTREDLGYLVEALTHLAGKQKGLACGRGTSQQDKPLKHELPPVALTLQEAMQRPHQWVSLEEAQGKVVAESIIPYPPGVPLLVPGEVLEPAMAENIREMLKAGAEIIGLGNKNQVKLVVNP